MRAEHLAQLGQHLGQAGGQPGRLAGTEHHGAPAGIHEQGVVPARLGHGVVWCSNPWRPGGHRRRARSDRRRSTPDQRHGVGGQHPGGEGPLQGQRVGSRRPTHPAGPAASSVRGCLPSPTATPASARRRCLLPSSVSMPRSNPRGHARQHRQVVIAAGRCAGHAREDRLGDRPVQVGMQQHRPGVPAAVGTGGDPRRGARESAATSPVPGPRSASGSGSGSGSGGTVPCGLGSPVAGSLHAIGGGGGALRLIGFGVGQRLTDTDSRTQPGQQLADHRTGHPGRSAITLPGPPPRPPIPGPGEPAAPTAWVVGHAGAPARPNHPFGPGHAASTHTSRSARTPPQPHPPAGPHRSTPRSPGSASRCHRCRSGTPAPVPRSPGGRWGNRSIAVPRNPFQGLITRRSISDLICFQSTRKQSPDNRAG